MFMASFRRPVRIPSPGGDRRCSRPPPRAGEPLTGLAGSGVRPFSWRRPSAIAQRRPPMPSARAVTGPRRGSWPCQEASIMKTVAQLLRTKGHEVLSVSPELSVFEALEVMAEKNVGALLVLEGERLVGVFSERDYARKVILKGKASKEIPVREIMSTHVLYVRPQQTIEDCMALMTDTRVRHLPAMGEERLVGGISIGDGVKGIIAG